MKTDVLEALEFLRVRELLAGLASSYLGKQRLQALRPLADRSEAEGILDRVESLRELRNGGNPLPVLEIPDLGRLLAKLDREGTRLDPEEFLALGRLLEHVRTTAAHLKGEDAESEALRELSARLEPQPELETLIQKTFEPTGDIKDSASPALRKIRRERERIRSSLRRTMEKQAGDLSEGALVTVRDGRFVLSVPQKREKRVRGIVHDRSGTGSTVYMEPLTAVDENNRLSEQNAAEFEEIQRLLAALTVQFAAKGDSLDASYHTLGELDALDARARLASRWRCTRPRFSDEPRVELVQARHPLLLEARDMGAQPDRALSQVIPLSLDLQHDRRLLLISGPNMGGKTVALKTVGLVSLMAQAGLCVPADTAELGWFRSWVADLGDDQSLEGDLSTFGGHLKRWAEALEQAGPQTMVLIDEMGSGTDPTEGAALAQSVLEVLAGSGSLGVVTTHLGALKRFAASTEGVENASMIFDGDSGAPTFTLAPGVPGDSHALDMAAHLGFPRERVERAQALLSPEERHLKKLIADVEDERERLRRESREAAKEKAAARESAREAKDALQRVLEARSKVRDRTARQARHILQQAQEQARALEKSTRGGASGAALKQAAARQAELSKLEQAATSSAPEAGAVPQTVEPGRRYVALSLGAPVTVLRVDEDGRVVVDRRGMKVELPLSDLRETTSEPEAPKPPRPAAPPAEPADASGEIHLLGMRRDQALEELDQALDRALLAGLPELRVVHGFGTGALMKAVREFVKSHPAVSSFRVGEKGEGGGGATIVRLKDA